MEFIINNIAIIISVICGVNVVAFCYMYIIARTNLIKWNEAFNYIILFLLSTLFGYIAIKVSCHMYQYKKDNPFFKYILPICFGIEIFIFIVIFVKSDGAQLLNNLY